MQSTFNISYTNQHLHPSEKWGFLFSNLKICFGTRKCILVGVTCNSPKTTNLVSVSLLFKLYHLCVCANVFSSPYLKIWFHLLSIISCIFSLVMKQLFTWKQQNLRFLQLLYILAHYYSVLFFRNLLPDIYAIMISENLQAYLSGCQYFEAFTVYIYKTKWFQNVQVKRVTQLLFVSFVEQFMYV